MNMIIRYMNFNPYIIYNFYSKSYFFRSKNVKRQYKLHMVMMKTPLQVT